MIYEAPLRVLLFFTRPRRRHRSSSGLLFGRPGAPSGKDIATLHWISLKKDLTMIRTMRWRNLCVLVAFLTAMLAICTSGCSQKGEAEASIQRPPERTKPRSGGRLVIGVAQEPERLSQILNATAINGMICNLIFSKFVKYDDHLNLIPDLIERLPTVENGGISMDRLTYTYHLRRDATWHDGPPVTSADVKFTYEIIMDPDVNVESREGWDEISVLETPDPYTVVFHLKQPYPDFVAETFFEESVLPAHILSGETGKRFGISDFHRAPVGCGPFVFKEWVSGSHIMVTANRNFYGDGPYLDAIIVKFVTNENALLVQFKSGEIDVYDNVSVSHLARLEGEAGVSIQRTPTLMYEHLDLNVENTILKDKRVRQAIAFATDKRVIADVVYEGLAEVALLDEHPSSRYFSKKAAARVEYDPVKARRLLRDAGWVDANGDGILEKNGERLTLTVSATTGNRNRERTQMVLREQYRDVGIELKIKNYNPTVLYGGYDDGGVLKRGKFDIAMYAWLSSPEPATKESLYSMNTVPPNGQNHPRIRHEKLTRLLELGATETDEVRRIRTYYEVSEILVDETPVIPLFWYITADVCTDRLRNYRPNPTQSADTWNANSWYLVD